MLALALGALVLSVDPIAPASTPAPAAANPADGAAQVWLKKRKRLRILAPCFAGLAVGGAIGIGLGVASSRDGSSADPHGWDAVYGVAIGAPLLAAGVVGLIATGIAASIHQSKKPDGLAFGGGKLHLSLNGYGVAGRF